MDDFKISMTAARVNAKLTQQETAEALGIDRTSYINYEKGEAIMRMDVAFKFSQLVHIPMEHIDFCLSKNTA